MRPNLKLAYKACKDSDHKVWPSGVPKGQGLCGRGLVGVTFVGMALASKLFIKKIIEFF